MTYPFVLTPAQDANNFHALQFIAFFSRGVGVPLTLNYSKTNQLTCDGDSLFNGTPGGVTPPCNNSALATALNGSWSINNVAVGGTTAYTHVAEVPLSDGTKCSPLAQFNFALNDDGINDLIVAGDTAAGVYANRVAWAQAAKKAGCSPMWTTLVSSSGADSLVQAANTLMRANAARLGVQIVDLAEDPCSGKTGAYANPGSCANFQSDGLHETQTGANIWLGLIANDVNYLTGASEASPTLVTGATYAMLYSDGFVQDIPSGSTSVLTLPSCIGLSSAMAFTVYHAEAAHTVTVVPASGQNLDGGSSAVTVPTFGKLKFIPYGLAPSTAGCYWVSQ